MECQGVVRASCSQRDGNPGAKADPAQAAPLLMGELNCSPARTEHRGRTEDISSGHLDINVTSDEPGREALQDLSWAQKEKGSPTDGSSQTIGLREYIQGTGTGLQTSTSTVLLGQGLMALALR